MVLNAVHFGAKRKVKCGKMGDEKHKNTHQGDRQDLFEPLKIGLKRGKTAIKKRDFRGEKRVIGLENFESSTKLER